MSGVDGARAAAAAAAVDREALLRDAARLVRVPSETGDERAACAEVVAIAEGLGLAGRLATYAVDDVERLPDYPGRVAERDEVVNATVSLPGSDPSAPRFLLQGHVDVVSPGTRPWQHGAWSGALADGRLHGRGAVDMKGAVVAMLHALAAVRASGEPLRGEVVLQAVSSEEDAGCGAVAALHDDAAFAGCLIPEPTGLAVVCMHAGSIQFELVVRGRSAHAATRLAGDSALDRYVEAHLALRRLEDELNAEPMDPLMRALPLPYAVQVGRIEGGRWASQVPDEVRAQGRVGVPVGADADAIWRRAVAAIEAAAGREHVELRRLAVFTPCRTDADDPLPQLAGAALAAETGRPTPLAGVPWAADMRHVAARGIPCVMVGTTGIERAHAVDEWVDCDELVTLARAIARLLVAREASAAR